MRWKSHFLKKSHLYRISGIALFFINSALTDRNVHSIVIFKRLKWQWRWRQQQGNIQNKTFYLLWFYRANLPAEVELKNPKRVRRPCKGQLIWNIFQKRTKIFKFTTMVPQIELFSFVFCVNWRHQKDISKLTDLYKQPENFCWIRKGKSDGKNERSRKKKTWRPVKGL